MKYFLLIFFIFSCNKDFVPYRPISSSSCLQSAGSEDSPFDNAYCFLPSGESLAVGQSLKESFCSFDNILECTPGGKLKVTIQPKNINCLKKCEHPWGKGSLSEGESLTFSTLPSGTLGECQNAVRKFRCGDSLPAKKHTHCAVIGLPGKVIQRWSDKTTWKKRLPENGDDVVIDQDQVVLLDTATPHLRTLDIKGILVFDDQDVSLTSHKIMLSGAIKIGSQKVPFEREAEIWVRRNAAFKEPSGIFIQGGVIQTFGLKGKKETLIWGIPTFRNIHLRRDI